ncbi:MAG: hypothetical protein BroJett011_29950 [Chloroflexota bacterium]|nr:MAG: hypothetical protein BroJett011_29950 [Chloroflexota bacterium]
MAKVNEQNILESAPQRLTLVDKSLAAFLALLLFGVYMVTFDGTLHSTDGLSMLAVAENVAKHGRFDTRQLEDWENVSLGMDGQPYTKYPLGPTLLMLPFVLLALTVPPLGVIQTTLVLMPLSTALAMPYVYLSARRLGYAPKVATVLTLLAGLASMAWPRTRDLVADPLILWCFIASFYYALTYRQDHCLKDAALLGVVLGLAVLHKAANIVVVPFFCWYMVAPEANSFDWRLLKKSSWRALLIAGAGWTAGLLIIGVYNFMRFGSLFETGYEAGFTTPVWLGVAGFIISPYKSIFLYTPLLVLIPFVVKQTWRRHPLEVYLITAVFISQALVFAAWHDWGGGDSWGPRFLMPASGLALFLLLPFIQQAFQSNRWRWRASLILFGLLSLLLQLLAISVRDYVYLDASDYWTPPPAPSLWGELRWDRPDQWPIGGHLLRFDLAHIPVIWRWQWGELSHFDLLTLLAALLIVALGGVGVMLAWNYRFRELFLSRKLLGGGAWLVVLGCVGVMLVRSYNDPRSIEQPEETDELWPAYSALVSDLPKLVAAGDSLIFTDDRFGFYLLDRDKSPAQRYLIADAAQSQILKTVPLLLQTSAEQGRIWLVANSLDDQQLSYATQLWLRAHATLTDSYTFGNSVRLSAFEPLPSRDPWEPILPESPLAVLVDPDDYRFHRIAALLGWNWPDFNPDTSASFQTGQTYHFELFWIYHGKAPQDTFFVRLLDSARRPVSETWLSPELEDSLIEGQLMIEKAGVLIPAELAPGLYHLQLGFSTSAVEAGELIFDLPAELTEIRVIPKNS